MIHCLIYYLFLIQMNNDDSDRWEASNYGRSVSTGRVSYDDASTFGGGRSRGGYGGSRMGRSRSSDEFDNSAVKRRSYRGYSDDGSLETPHTLSDGEIEDDIGAPPGEIGWNVDRSGLRNNRSTKRDTFQSIFFDE